MHRLNAELATRASTAEINLSPLIDMVFLLLIFFMVTTVFVQETGVEVQKPAAATAEDLEKNSILIAVTQGGEIVHAGRTIGIHGVRGVVSRNLKDRDMPVIVTADRVAQTGIVVDVIDECKQAGASDVSIAARREQ